MENNLHEEENYTQQQRQKPKNGRSIWFYSGVSSIVGSLVTSTVFLAGGNYFHDTQRASNAAQPKTAVQSSSQNSKLNVQNTSYNKGSSNIADMVEKSSKAVVGVVNLQAGNNGDLFSQDTTSQNVEAGSGSGVIYKKENGSAYIVTNNHVIEDAKEVQVALSNGVKTKAEIVGADPLSDLAVLKIDGSKAPDALSFGDSDSLRAGDQVIAIGNPLGLDLSRTVTEGIVSAVGRTVPVSTSQGEWELNVIQTDAAINPGNSGGALINSNGEVIGINSMKISESGVEGLGFALPSNDVLPIVNQLIKEGKVKRPYIGVSLSNLDELPQYYLQNAPKNLKNGVMVTGVDPKSAAARSGILEQDIIVSINGKKVANSSELRKYLYTKVGSNDKVTLGVYRGDIKKNVTVQLGN
ncbi:serine protease Do [Bacillus sp. OV322]|uniref:S1C family serine protease n=1 Tax=Bacillus sp. OV322 TaxID=1882764 RepID=UPI0008EC87C7|nr:trypsin-like peptidase domain-containing protein [Bacillus sp. OV322]SFC88169.1 serine protease Do [Bacillus sp. OV322]